MTRQEQFYQWTRNVRGLPQMKTTKSKTTRQSQPKYNVKEN